VSVTWIVLAGLVCAAGIPYIIWTRIEARSHRRAHAVHAEIAEMGDEVVPVSLHPDINLDECIGSGACIRSCPEHDVLAITDGRARLINPLSCVGHSACMQACPVSAITLVFGTAKRGIELPKLTQNYETSRGGVYIVGELSGMGLIRNATLQGRQCADAMAKSPKRGVNGAWDVIVVGSGPSGLACALGLMAHGLKVHVVEQNEFGGTIAHYPRAKIVMTGTFELPGYGTVRGKTMSKEELIELWHDVKARTGLDVEEGVRVEGLQAVQGGWRARGVKKGAGGGEAWEGYGAMVVLALGRRGAPRKLEVAGEELPKVVYRLLEPEQFAGKHVMVVGGGNAAADCAIALAEAKVCASVSLSYRRTELARLRSSVKQRMSELVAEKAIIPYLGTEVTSIAMDHVELKSERGVKHVRNDNVVIQVGGTSPSDLLKTIGIELIEKRGTA
jgi:thioredoxin reductase/NAD-dependent dihydropyrimidine dehydrogenase PreA subunit